jgi:hypothetical protein
MPDLELRTGPPGPDVPTDVVLAELAVHLRRTWPALPAPLMLEWSDSPVVALDHEVPWIYGPVERDPLRGSNGGTVIPRRVRARLNEFAALGVPFQRLAIAHELDRDGPVRHILPALDTGAQNCTDEVARALVGVVPTHQGTARAVRALDAAVGAMSGARTRSQLLNFLRDPIIFGIIARTPPRHGELCLWYVLAAWRW